MMFEQFDCGSRPCQALGPCQAARPCQAVGPCQAKRPCQAARPCFPNRLPSGFKAHGRLKGAANPSVVFMQKSASAWA
ncbi:unnamed protein product [Ixodes pacificus]